MKYFWRVLFAAVLLGGVAAAQAAEPIKILRDAFSATMRDKEFLADAERTRIDVEPSSGERVQRLVEQLYATSKATVERAKESIKP